jgi:hypothetical protein
MYRKRDGAVIIGDVFPNDAPPTDDVVFPAKAVAELLPLSSLNNRLIKAVATPNSSSSPMRNLLFLRMGALPTATKCTFTLDVDLTADLDVVVGVMGAFAVDDGGLLPAKAGAPSSFASACDVEAETDPSSTTSLSDDDAATILVSQTSCVILMFERETDVNDAGSVGLQLETCLCPIIVSFVNYIVIYILI